MSIKLVMRCLAIYCLKISLGMENYKLKMFSQTLHLFVGIILYVSDILPSMLIVGCNITNAIFLYGKI